VKRAAEYGSSMDAMQLSLDEIRRQCTDKDAKLDQFRMMLEQYEKQEVFSHVHWTGLDFSHLNWNEQSSQSVQKFLEWSKNLFLSCGVKLSFPVIGAGVII